MTEAAPAAIRRKHLPATAAGLLESEEQRRLIEEVRVARPEQQAAEQVATVSESEQAVTKRVEPARGNFQLRPAGACATAKVGDRDTPACATLDVGKGASAAVAGRVGATMQRMATNARGDGSGGGDGAADTMPPQYMSAGIGRGSALRGGVMHFRLKGHRLSVTLALLVASACMDEAPDASLFACDGAGCGASSVGGDAASGTIADAGVDTSVSDAPVGLDTAQASDGAADPKDAVQAAKDAAPADPKDAAQADATNDATLDTAGASDAGPAPCAVEGGCDDGKAWTVDTCVPGTGCAHTWSMQAACAEAGGKPSADGCVKTEAGIEWGLVPAGEFSMGCNAKLDTVCQPDEQPQHTVEISKPFWLALTETTVAAYAACVQGGPCTEPTCASTLSNWNDEAKKQHPVNCANWKQAAVYCAWAGGALPTEAQWALAARGRCEDNGDPADCATTVRLYPWGNSAPTCGKHAVFDPGSLSGCGKGGTWPVKEGSAAGRGPYGHFDLAGNVYEWVADWYAHKWYDVSPVLDPLNNTPADSHATRGGSFYSPFQLLRASNRDDGPPPETAWVLGFRCARSYP